MNDDMTHCITVHGRFPDTGMRITEAIDRASAWWDKTGRHLVKTESNLTEVGRQVRTGIVVPGEMTPELDSGILQAWPWAQLNQREQMAIVIRWHHDHIAVPDAGAAPYNPRTAR